MTLDDFKDVYKDKTPLEKLNLMCEQYDIWRSDAESAERARLNGSKGLEYLVRECGHMRDRVQWLYSEIANALHEPQVTCSTCKHSKCLSGEWFCFMIGSNRYGKHVMDGDWYCKDAERR